MSQPKAKVSLRSVFKTIIWPRKKLIFIGLIFILNGVVGLLGFEAKGWQTYAVGLVTWVISFWLAGLIIRRRDEETENAQ